MNAMVDVIEAEIHQRIRNPFYVRLGSQIKMRREYLHLRLVDVSDKTGLSAPTISLIERGEQNCDVDQLLKIAAALDTHIARLLPRGPGNRPDVDATFFAASRADELAAVYLDLSQPKRNVVIDVAMALSGA